MSLHRLTISTLVLAALAARLGAQGPPVNATMVFVPDGAVVTFDDPVRISRMTLSEIGPDGSRTPLFVERMPGRAVTRHRLFFAVEARDYSLEVVPAAGAAIVVAARPEAGALEPFSMVLEVPYTGEADVKCWLEDNAGVKVADGVVQLTAFPPGSMNGTWLATFTNVTATRGAATYKLVAEGQTTKSTSSVANLTVSSTGTDLCPVISFGPLGAGQEDGFAVAAVGVTAAKPVEGSGSHMPVTISGMAR